MPGIDWYTGSLLSQMVAAMHPHETVRKITDIFSGESMSTVLAGSVPQTAGRLDQLQPTLEIRTGEARPGDMKVFSSGAKSTVVKPRYDLCPQRALELMANRFAYGASRHGERNYLNGANDEEFKRDRINHLIEHCMRFAASRQQSDLEAILCNAAILAEVKADTGGCASLG